MSKKDSLKVNNIEPGIESILVSFGIFWIFDILFESKNYCLEKITESFDADLKKHKQVTDGPIITCGDTKLNIDYIQDEETKKYVNIFIDVINKNIDPLLLETFYININNVMIETNQKRIKRKTLGYYDVDENRIALLNKNKLSIFHELFHLASSIKEENSYYCGFHQLNITDEDAQEVGIGLNEGYTEHLVKTYFTSYETEDSYDFQRHTTNRLEAILGKDLMQRFYFNSNLKGLIKELTKYISLQEVMEFINTLDFITTSCSISDFIFAEYINDLFVRVQNFLLKLYIAKLKDDSKLNDIDALFNILDFNDSLAYTIGDEKYFFTFTLDKDVVESLIYEYYPNLKNYQKIPRR